MYAIVFDLAIADLKSRYGEPYHRAYSDIRKVMRQNDFHWIQGSTYVTDQRLVSVTLAVNALNGIGLVQEIRSRYPGVQDRRLVRLYDNVPIFLNTKNGKLPCAHTSLQDTKI